MHRAPHPVMRALRPPAAARQSHRLSSSPWSASVEDTDDNDNDVDDGGGGLWQHGRRDHAVIVVIAVVVIELKRSSVEVADGVRQLITNQEEIFNKTQRLRDQPARSGATATVSHLLEQLDTLDSNYLGWSSAMAPVIMGAPGQPALSDELTESFCRTEPDIAKQFARVTFMSDNRQDVIGLPTPVLILQSSNDLIALVAVGEYLHSVLPNSTYCLVDNVGHCPHMSAPQACAAAMDAFLVPWMPARAG